MRTWNPLTQPPHYFLIYLVFILKQEFQILLPSCLNLILFIFGNHDIIIVTTTLTPGHCWVTFTCLRWSGVQLKRSLKEFSTHPQEINYFNIFKQIYEILSTRKGLRYKGYVRKLILKLSLCFGKLKNYRIFVVTCVSSYR